MDVTVSLRSPAVRYFAAVGEVAGHLQTQFAGGHHDQRPRDAGQLARRVGGDALQQGYAERVGLAHAGAGLTDQVVAGKRQRQSQFLDGKCMFDAIFGQCAHYFVANSEFGKCWVSAVMLGRRSLSMSILVASTRARV